MASTAIWDFIRLFGSPYVAVPLVRTLCIVMMLVIQVASTQAGQLITGLITRIYRSSNTDTGPTMCFWFIREGWI